jgi:hypothetical protein
MLSEGGPESRGTNARTLNMTAQGVGAAHIIALLDSLATLGPLNQQQKDVVARVRAANTNLCQQG